MTRERVVWTTFLVASTVFITIAAVYGQCVAQ
jgi:hypothetical protein